MVAGVGIQLFLSDGGAAGIRQGGIAVVGVVLAIWLSRLEGKRAWVVATIVGALSFLGLLAVFALPAVRGVHSWIRLGPLSIQPSEIAKVGLIFVLALLFGAQQGRGFGPLAGGAWAFLVSGVVILLVAIQPDLGTAIVMAGTTWVQFLASRVPKVLTAGIPLLCVGILFALGPRIVPIVKPLLKPHQIERVENFFAQEKDEKGANWQIRQAHLQMGAGGWTGSGFRSDVRHELEWLPEQENDFVFAVVGRTTGFVGSLVVILLFMWAVLSTLAEGSTLSEGGARHMLWGLASYLGVHSVLNIAVVLALVPATGFPLVPLSLGGSSVVGLSLLVGIAAAGLHRGGVNYNPRIDSQGDRPKRALQ